MFCQFSPLSMCHSRLVSQRRDKVNNVCRHKARRRRFDLLRWRNHVPRARHALTLNVKADESAGTRLVTCRLEVPDSSFPRHYQVLFMSYLDHNEYLDQWRISSTPGREKTGSPKNHSHSSTHTRVDNIYDSLGFLFCNALYVNVTKGG
jgi:hypothetical protein